MIKTDPLAIATKGIVKSGGSTDPLGMATIGWLVVDDVVVPPSGDGQRRRRTYFTMIGRSRLGR